MGALSEPNTQFFMSTFYLKIKDDNNSSELFISIYPDGRIFIAPANDSKDIINKRELVELIEKATKSFI